MQILFPVSRSLDKTSLNSTHQLGFTFTRNPNTYYLLNGPNGEPAPLAADISTFVAQCKLRINSLELRTRIIEYNTQVLENYVNTFRDVQPDAYQFMYHQEEGHTYVNNQRSYRRQIVTDTILDKTAFCIQHTNALDWD